MISAAEDTRARELEIYSQIWESPGSDACPQKMIEFVKNIKKGSTRQFNITSVEVADITQSLIRPILMLRLMKTSETNFIGVLMLQI